MPRLTPPDSDDRTDLGPEMRRKLDAFLVDNDDLEALTARLARFNLFQVLKLERVEIRHSNMLAWLMDPTESHGLGAAFARRFLSRTLLENEFTDVAISPADIELMDLTDIQVRREWKNIDVLATSESGKWTLLIENKIGSREKKGALQRYAESARHEWPDRSLVPILLSVDGDEPSDDGRDAGFVGLSHAQVLETATRVAERHRSRIPDDAHVLIEHYLELLRRLTMQDDQLVTLCKRIYRKHREAIDLIAEYGAASQVLDGCEAEIAEAIQPTYMLRTTNRVFWLPKEMPDIEVAELNGWTHLKRRFPLIWWVHYGKRAGKLQVCLEVGPIADTALRKRLLTAAEEAGFEFWSGGYEEGRKYTRIVSKTKKLRRTSEGEVDDDEEYVRSVLADLWEKAWGEGAAIVDVMRNMSW